MTMNELSEGLIFQKKDQMKMSFNSSAVKYYVSMKEAVRQNPRTYGWFWILENGICLSMLLSQKSCSVVTSLLSSLEWTKYRLSRILFWNSPRIQCISSIDALNPIEKVSLFLSIIAYLIRIQKERHCYCRRFPRYGCLGIRHQTSLCSNQQHYCRWLISLFVFI